MKLQEHVHFSNLKWMSRSPAHYAESVRTSADSAAFRLGRLVDAIIYDQPHVIHSGVRAGHVWACIESILSMQPYHVCDLPARAGKAWAAYKEVHADAPIYLIGEVDEARAITSRVASVRDIYTESERDEAQAIVAAVKGHPRALDLLTVGSPQVELAWEWLGRSIHSRADTYTPARLVDLKTTRSAQPDWFQREADRYHYDAQMAFYRRALRTLGLSAAEECYLVTVEKDPPHPVVVHRLSESRLEAGERKCRLWMERLLACEAADHWPGYVESDVTWDLVVEDELTFGEEEFA